MSAFRHSWLTDQQLIYVNFPALFIKSDTLYFKRTTLSSLKIMTCPKPNHTCCLFYIIGLSQDPAYLKPVFNNVSSFVLFFSQSVVHKKKERKKTKKKEEKHRKTSEYANIEQHCQRSHVC